MNIASGFMCPKCGNTRQHNIQWYERDADQNLVAIGLTCGSCENFWIERSF